MLLDEPYDWRLDCEQQARLARDYVYPNNQSQLLPVLPNDYLRWLRELKDIPTNIQTTQMTLEELENTFDTDSDEFKEIKSQRRDTGVADSLLDEIKAINDDIRGVYHPTWTKSIRMNNQIQRDIDDYFAKRIYRYMQRIYQHIQAMIIYDDWSELSFGDYQKIVQSFEVAKSDAKRQECLDSLIMIALSNIPYEIKKKQTKNIESSLSSAIRTT